MHEFTMNCWLMAKMLWKTGWGTAFIPGILLVYIAEMLARPARGPALKPLRKVVRDDESQKLERAA